VVPSTTVRDLTWEFSSTAMSLCGLICRVRCRDVLLSYDSSAASDVQCAILFHVSLVMPHLDYGNGNAILAGLPASQLRRLQSVLNAAARLIGPTSIFVPHLLNMSTSHRCYGTFTGCGLRNASTSSRLCSFTDARMSPLSGATVSLRLHLARCRFQPPASPVVVILAADVHGCARLAIVRYRWLEAASRTVCRPTSPQLQR